MGRSLQRWNLSHPLDCVRVLHFFIYIHSYLICSGQPFTIHPLDVVIPSLSNSSICVGSFIPTKLSVGAGEFDWVVGTNILRSVYSVYDFGNFDSKGNMGDPYVQLLSVVNITEAAADFQQIRGGTVNVQDSNGSPSPSISVESSSDQLEKLVSMIPILFAIAGANGLILLILLVGAVWFCCFRGRNKKAKKVAPLPLATVSAATYSYEAVPTVEDGQERPSSARSPRLTRTISKQSQRSLVADIDELPHSSLKAQSDAASRKSRYSLLKHQTGDGDSPKRSSRVSLARNSPSPVPSIKKGFVNVEGQLVEHHTEDITDGAKKPFHPVPPPIVVPVYRRSAYSENAASPTVAGSDRGTLFLDAPIRASMAVSSGSPSPTASQFEDARGSMYSVATPPTGPLYANPGVGVNNVSVPPALIQHYAPPPHMDPQTLSQRQEAQRVAFMAALDNEPLPPPRRPHGFGGGGPAGEPRQRLSAYSAAPVVSQDMRPPAGPSNADAIRHSYAAPMLPPGASVPQRSSYVPNANGGPFRRPPFNPSPFNPSSNGDGTN